MSLKMIMCNFITYIDFRDDLGNIYILSPVEDYLFKTDIHQYQPRLVVRIYFRVLKTIFLLIESFVCVYFQPIH